MGSSGKFKRSSVASPTGQPGKGGGLVVPVYRERVVKRLRHHTNRGWPKGNIPSSLFPVLGDMRVCSHVKVIISPMFRDCIQWSHDGSSTNKMSRFTFMFTQRL
jgi:hypothetical protein